MRKAHKSLQCMQTWILVFRSSNRGLGKEKGDSQFLSRCFDQFFYFCKFYRRSKVKRSFSTFKMGKSYRIVLIDILFLYFLALFCIGLLVPVVYFLHAVGCLLGSSLFSINIFCWLTYQTKYSVLVSHLGIK